MTVEDHHKMVDLLLGCTGMFVLSGYRTPVYAPLESDGWKRVEIDTFADTSKTREKRTECLWLSPNCLIKKDILAYKDIDEGGWLTNRQKAALRVHRYRSGQSEATIKKAIYSLKRMKKKVTKVEVARITGISREHITRNYGHLF